MSKALLFWVLMILWLIFGVWQNFSAPTLATVGGTVFQFFLFAIVGWKVFGKPINE